MQQVRSGAFRALYYSRILVHGYRITSCYSNSEKLRKLKTYDVYIFCPVLSLHIRTLVYSKASTHAGDRAKIQFTVFFFLASWPYCIAFNLRN